MNNECSPDVTRGLAHEIPASSDPVHLSRSRFTTVRVRTRVLTACLTLAAVATLIGCTAAVDAPAPADTAGGPQPDPSPSLTRNPPEPDSILWVRALATAPNGAELELEAMVHRSLSYEYPGSQTMNQIIIDDCGATLTNAIIYAEAWSITRLNVTAIPPADSVEWPTGQRVGFRPSGDVVYAAGRGIVQSDPATGDLGCLQDKFLAGAGRGAIAVGIPGDTTDLDHFGNGWARHTWGFTALDGVVLSDCRFEITDLGPEYGAGAGWVEVADSASCYVGPAAETAEF